MQCREHTHLIFWLWSSKCTCECLDSYRMLSHCSAFYYTMQRERRRETGVGCVLGFRARTRCATSARWLIRVRVWWRSRGGIKEWEKDRLRKLERTWSQQQPLLVASKALREEKKYTVEIHFINILYGSLQHVYLIIMINEKIHLHQHREPISFDLMLLYWPLVILCSF